VAILPDLWLMVLQAIPFAVTLFVLNKVIFGPMITYLKDRDVAIVGSRQDALKLQDTAADKLSAYEAKVSDARTTLTAERNVTRNKALEAREALIDGARADAEKKVAEAVAVIDGEKALASAELERLSRGLATDITHRILGTEVAAK
jgi:F-type H+-transporting ATPase subunit b